MKKLTLAACLDVIESLRTLSHQIEQKNYMLLQHDATINNIAHGIQEFRTLQNDYTKKQQDITSKIEELKSFVDLDEDLQ